MGNITIYDVIPIFLAFGLILLTFLQMKILKRRMEKENEEFGKKLVKMAGEQDTLSSMETNEQTEEK